MEIVIIEQTDPLWLRKYCKDVSLKWVDVKQKAPRSKISVPTNVSHGSSICNATILPLAIILFQLKSFFLTGKLIYFLIYYLIIFSDL